MPAIPQRATPPITVIAAAAAVLAVATTVASAVLTPRPTPVGVSMPSGPVGTQLTWVVEQLNGTRSPLTDDELAAHFTPSFLAAVPAAVLRDQFAEVGEGRRPIVLTRFIAPPSATGAAAEITTRTGERGAVTLRVEDQPPHRLVRLEIMEAPPVRALTGRRVAVGETMYFIDCVGTDGPTTVLMAGLASDWADVRRELSTNGRVCSYDRPDSPGTASEPAVGPSAAEDVVAEVRSVLHAAGEAGPYVLVGHSMAGLYVQLYAHEHPQEVAGLVLVDPTPEEFATALAGFQSSPGAAAIEQSAQDQSFAQMRSARARAALPAMPVTVLTHGRAATESERPPGWPIAKEERLLAEMHAAIAAATPGGRHLVVAESGHDIHQDQPRVVSDAIRDVRAAAIRALSVQDARRAPEDDR